VCASAQFSDISRRVNNALLPEGFVAWRWAEGLERPRQITRLPNSRDLLVVETSPNRRVTLLFDDNNDGVSDASERIILIRGNATELPSPTNLGLNHAVYYRAGFIYASTDTTVYRWAYTVGSRAPITAAPEILVTGIPAGGRHSTRSLEFDRFGRLYVQLGSAVDIASDTSRDRIHRFDFNFDTTTFSSPLDYYGNGTVYATGLRNPVGFRFDSQDNCFAVEQGIDVVRRNDLGGDFTYNNPAEELMLLPNINTFVPGSTPNFYGYPYCWTEFFVNTTAAPRGLGFQWADSNWMMDGVHNDTWCRNPVNNVAPVGNLDPHSAALDINYYTPSGNGPSNFGSSRDQYAGVAFIAQHGSHPYIRAPFNTGYQIVAVRYTSNGQGGVTINSQDSFFRSQGPTFFPENWWRPVSLTFAPNRDGSDTMFVTADSNNTVLAIAYNPALYVRNQLIPDDQVTAPPECPQCPACPATPTPTPVPCGTASPSPSPCCNSGSDNDGPNTSINFYFADMLRGTSNN